MKKLLIASSVALLALSFQAGAASLPILELTKLGSSPFDMSKMQLLPGLNVSSEQVSAYGQITKGQSFAHDWGLQSDTADVRIASYNNVASNKAAITAVGLYSDSSFTTKIASAVLKDNQWVLRGVLGTANQVYGLRIEGFGDKTLTSGSYTTNTSTVPVPGAVWLFGSAIAGLVGFSKRKKAGLTA